MIAIIMASITTTFAQTDHGTINRFGVGAELVAVGGNGIGYGGALEYKYTFEKDGFVPAHIVGGNLLLGASVADNSIHILVGGGYDANITYERGQFFAAGRINTPVVAVSGKYYVTKRTGYTNNYEFAINLYPTKGVLGIGGFYMTEYDCTVIGGKISLRFGGNKSSSSDGSRRTRGGGSRTCFGCGL